MGAEIARSVKATVENLQKWQEPRIRQLIIAARLYGNSSLLGISGFRGEPPIHSTAPKERLTDNVIQSVIDTSTARVGENKPRPYFLTDGGTYTLQRRAKQLNKFLEGVFYETGAYRMGSDAQRDCETFGDGLIHVDKRNGRIRHERVMSAELWVDEAEAIYGKPRQMHWVRAVDRDELAEWVKDWLDGKELKDAIMAIYRANAAPLDMRGYPSVQADMVAVRESWHLRSGPDADDGKQCITIDDCLLGKLNDWPHDFFPFARWRWCPRPMGYWSQGLAEQLQNKQIEVNRLLWIMQRSMELAGTFKIFLEEGSKIVSEHLNNQIGAIVKYKGTKPDWFLPNVVPVEYYQQYERIVASMYERANVPIQAATGQKPAGLNSGEAQRVYRDTTNEGMKTKEALNEDAYLELGEIDIAIAREIALENGGKYEVKVPSGRALETISLSAKDLDPSAFEMKCFPVSSLPKDPAGRTATVQEWTQAGWINQRFAPKLMEFPDLEAYESLDTAAENLITKTLDAICDEGEYSPPEPTDNLSMAKEMVVEYIQRGRALDLPEDKMDLLRTYSIQVDALMALATPPPPAGPPGMPPGAPMAPGAGPPQANPMPPPTSGLIPNVPMQ